MGFTAHGQVDQGLVLAIGVPTALPLPLIAPPHSETTSILPCIGQHRLEAPPRVSVFSSVQWG